MADSTLHKGLFRPRKCIKQAAGNGGPKLRQRCGFPMVA